MNLGKQQPKQTYRDAVKEKCIECMGGRENKGFRENIRDCTSRKCPLFQLRPYK